MNKQEAILRLKAESWEYDDNCFRTAHVIDLDVAQEIISQIHKPQKVKIPQFVAKWYEKHKEGLYETIIDLIRDDERALYRQANPPTISEDDRRFLDWFFREDSAFEILVNMHQFGYEVEQEKLYTVEIPDPNANGYSIVLGRKDGKVQIKQTLSTTWEMNCSNHLPESEIKQDFDWAWQWAKPVEVE